MTVVLEGMSPAQEQGWLVLLDLFQNRRTDWTLIGGQMMYILAAENGVTMPRTTTDMDVVINVVESPGAIRALASQLLQQGFEFGDVSPAGTGGRFRKPADPGPGNIMFDVLAPEGLGERTDITTVVASYAAVMQYVGDVCVGVLEVLGVDAVGVKCHLPIKQRLHGVVTVRGHEPLHSVVLVQGHLMGCCGDAVVQLGLSLPDKFVALH